MAHGLIPTASLCVSTAKLKRQYTVLCLISRSSLPLSLFRCPSAFYVAPRRLNAGRQVLKIPKNWWVSILNGLPEAIYIRWNHPKQAPPKPMSCCKRCWQKCQIGNLKSGRRGSLPQFKNFISCWLDGLFSATIARFI